GSSDTTEPFRFFQRTLKFPCADLDSGRIEKDQIDEALRQLAERLAPASQLQCQLGANESRHFCATLKNSSFLVTLESQYGKNVAFISGQPHSFISYSIRAEARIPALNKAAATARRLGAACMIAGLLGGP